MKDPDKYKLYISDKVKLINPKIKLSNVELCRVITFQAKYIRELEKIIFEGAKL